MEEQEVTGAQSWFGPLAIILIGALNVGVATQGWQQTMGGALLVIGGIGLGMWLAEQGK